MASELRIRWRDARKHFTGDGEALAIDEVRRGCANIRLDGGADG